MLEELGFGLRNKLSCMNIYFAIDTIVDALDGNLIIIVVCPRYWLPGCLITWSLFVLFIYNCNTVPYFYAMRFFVWMFELAAWPGIAYIIRAWYRK
ncbi:hypothetical protein GQ53DRAFT_852108, partial [Thozetella sp. PMI_491]